MKVKKQIGLAFLFGAGVFVYVLAISFLLNYAGENFPKEDNIVTSIAALLLLTLSAAVVGSLIFGLPVYFALEKNIRLAIIQLLANLAWLIVFVIAVIIFLI